MNAQEFETAVRELRQLQRRFFRCKKDDPDREKSKMLMREKETVVREVVEKVMAIRPRGKRVENEREQFFLDVAVMLRKQKEWMMQGGGRWYMNPAKDAELTVDKQLTKWDEQRKEKEKARQVELLKNQTSLFDETDS